MIGSREVLGNMRYLVFCVVGFGALAAAIFLFTRISQKGGEGITVSGTIGGMEITSPAFGQNERIPEKYTCDGENVSPPLLISGVPEEAKSLVLISDDPDAPVGTWTHWTLWNIQPDAMEIKENSVPVGAVEGKTSFGSSGYGGPCPPSGTHRYFFKLYALDAMLALEPGAGLRDLERVMEEHTLAKAELVGLYSRVKE